MLYHLSYSREQSAVPCPTTEVPESRFPARNEPWTRNPSVGDVRYPLGGITWK